MSDIKITGTQIPFLLKNSTTLKSFLRVMLTFQEGLVFDLSETNNPQKRHEFNVLRIEREDGSGDRFNLYGHPAHQNGDVVVLVDFNTGAGVFTLSLP